MGLTLLLLFYPVGQENNYGKNGEKNNGGADLCCLC